jgi:chemotaxis signal transduction protein
MSTSGAQELRLAFDSSFAKEPAAPLEHVDLLGVIVAGRPHALRVTEIAAVVPAGEVVALPGEAPGLLGVAAVRGLLVTVYHLGVLLGAGSGEPPRWMVLSAGRDKVGFAFEDLEGFLQVPRGDVTESGPEPGTSGVREVARVGGALRPVASIPALLRQLGDRLGVHREES